MTDHQVFHRWHFAERECTVYLPDAALQTMADIAQRARPNETGGTLIGYYSEDRALAHVVKALGVRRGARSSRTRFYRPPDDVDGKLAEIYRNSGGQLYYLGEWHSHPSGNLLPSATDLRTLQDLARSPDVATDTPILILLAGDSSQAVKTACFLIEGSGSWFEGVHQLLTAGE